MRDYDHILAERHEDVLAITLNRPTVLNAAPPAMFDEIRDALADLDGARAVLFLGAGRAFCSGADVGGMRSLEGDAGAATEAKLNENYHPTLLAIAELGVPVVSAVRGPVAGIGCSLALAADFCLASDTAFFLQAFVNIGLVPDGGASWMLPRLVGRARAAEMLLLGERVPAAKALDWGMIHRVVDDASLEAEGLALAQRLARGPTAALGMIRRGLLASLQTDLATALAREATDQRAARNTADATEGGLSFLEKRPAEFKGR